MPVLYFAHHQGNSFFRYKESPPRPKEPKDPRKWESVRNTSLLAAGMGWTAGDHLLQDPPSASTFLTFWGATREMSMPDERA